MVDIDYSIDGIETFAKVDGIVKNVEISRLTAPGENFMSLVLRVDFELEKNGQSKTYSTVAKRLPLSGGPRGDFHNKVMTNEIKWYSDIVKLIRDFAKEHGIEGVDFIPEYCGSRYSLNPKKTEADKDSCLLLENLIPSGFKNIDRYKGFDLNSSKAILKRMAIYHSVPLAIKIIKPELFKVLKKFMESNIPKNSPGGFSRDKKNDDGSPTSRPGPEETFKKMINIPECAPYAERLQVLQNKPYGPQVWWFSEAAEPWSTMLHNDFWVNNIMINPRDGTEPLVKIVDYQMCTYGSYAKDLVFFLLTSVNNDVTKNYMDDLLRFYYEEFTSVLREVNVGLELTYTAFLKEVQRVALESEISHAIFFTNAVFGEKGTAPDFAVKEANLDEHMSKMVERMSQHQKDKLVLIVAEAINRNWM